jgi:hypothetical protein
LELGSKPLYPEVDPLVASGRIARIGGEEHIPATVQEAGYETMAARVLSEQGPDGPKGIHRGAAERALQQCATAEVRAAARSTLCE